MTKETKIGMTALLLFLAIGIAALLLHPMERLFPTTFPVYAVFDDAQGITPGASVLHAGVKVGRLKAITIEEGKASFTLRSIGKRRSPRMRHSPSQLPDSSVTPMSRSRAEICLPASLPAARPSPNTKTPAWMRS